MHSVTVGQLKKMLDKFNPNEKIYIWRGNGHAPYFDYTSNIKISRPYGNSDTNDGVVDHPLIISSDYDADKGDERKSRLW